MLKFTSLICCLHCYIKHLMVLEEWYCLHCLTIKPWECKVISSTYYMSVEAMFLPFWLYSFVYSTITWLVAQKLIRGQRGVGPCWITVQTVPIMCMHGFQFQSINSAHNFSTVVQYLYLIVKTITENSVTEGNQPSVCMDQLLLQKPTFIFFFKLAFFESTNSHLSNSAKQSYDTDFPK